jgi:hypothetical protein
MTRRQCHGSHGNSSSCGAAGRDAGSIAGMIIMTIWASTDSNGDLRPAAGFGLGVEPQEVVLGQTEPADWRLRFYTTVGSVPVVLVQPDRQLLGAPI